MSKTAIITLIVILLVLGSAVALAMAPAKPGPLDSFAQCLKEKEAIFYGAFWCPHCHEQKTLFGRSAKYLPYTECSTPDSKGQTQVCKDAGVESYPTWKFPNEDLVVGVKTLEELAGKTGCVLP